MTTRIRKCRCATAVASLVSFCALSSVFAQNTSGATTAVRLLTPRDLDTLPSRAPDRRIVYGDAPSQFGELRVPTGNGPHPVVILIHGGCFKAAYASRRYFGAMADTLKGSGIATWNVEYRRLGESGAGWPGTYRDVGKAIDHLRALAPEYHLDLSRVVVVGHSAGGHLAMWVAARSRLPRSSPLYATDPLAVRGVVDLAGPVDMTANIARYQELCGDTVITSLLGGTPESVPEHYAQASPIKLLPLGISQVIILGAYEEYVPLASAEAYTRAATQAGDSVRLVVIPNVGHFETASPRTSTWPQVESAIRSLIDGRLPPIKGSGRSTAPKRLSVIRTSQSAELDSWRQDRRRPSSHEDGRRHGPAHLELMSSVWLRQELNLSNGTTVEIEIGHPSKVDRDDG